MGKPLPEGEEGGCAQMAGEMFLHMWTRYWFVRDQDHFFVKLHLWSLVCAVF